MNKLCQYKQLLSNMGVRYLSFRLFYEMERKSGIMKRKFPSIPKYIPHLTLSEWKSSSQPFFFRSRETIGIPKQPRDNLKIACERILRGEIQFFSYQYLNLGISYDWVTNPDTGYQYDINKHWTEINDYSQEAGDIKYVWEKSRFSYLYTIIRYDYHFDEDHSEFVFSEITSWIKSNPVNRGPNYKCSQEISLRILNWIFVLYFYKNSRFLMEDLFQKILQSIYWQLHHVYHNIHFSRIAVRNNHAITETLTLYIVSTLFPQFPNSAKWKAKGKMRFEKEIEYQIYDDGTYLQFSMNYHRVVIQLLTWAIKTAEIHQEKFSSFVYEKAYKSLNFLYQCQEDRNGCLPNYGSNDGALFFKLSDNDYRDYRPQLDALHILLTGKSLYKEIYEDIGWYGNSIKYHFEPIKKQFGITEFELGGYYLIREPDTFTFIRCGKHFDRPAHADNLHLDVWYKGENILLDGGTYKYNTDDKNLKYFMGTGSHNTVMLDNHDQMLKGYRFIWYYWSQAIDVQMKETEEYFEFTGKISCFRHLSDNIIHERTIRKMKNKPEWDITDNIHHKPKNVSVSQLWHTPFPDRLILDSQASVKNEISAYSLYYGQTEFLDQMIFTADNNTIQTKITIKQ